jgi:tetratricopeptide (TPR) repeat protein
MIRPLDSSRNNWRLLWLDLEEPLPNPNSTEAGGEKEYYLPTCLLVTTFSGKPISPPEIIEEIDQAKAELFLGRLFEEHGTPDHLMVAESEDWDTEGWRSFAMDCRLEIAFGAFPSGNPSQLKQLTRKIMQNLQGELFCSREAVARGLVSTARRLRSLSKKVAHLRKAIEQDADCSLARIELADTDYQAGRWKDCSTGYREIISREERRWQSEKPKWWIDSETRPYLRALYGHAMTEWQQGRFDRTSDDLQRLLSLNPTDNQGVRFLLPLVYLLAEDDTKALKALTEYEINYPGDYSEPALLFGKGIACWRSGEEELAREAYGSGMMKNPYIAPLILDLPSPPSDIWYPNDRAEPGYAQDFIQSYGILWERDPAAVRFMREMHSELIPKLENLIALRKKMIEWQDQRYDRNFKVRWKEMTDSDELMTGSSER